MHTPHKYPDNAYKNIINFYEEFKYEVAGVSAAKYGNAIETVDYSTDGEGSDWMLGEHKIVAFSPELGSFNKKAQTFFLPKDLINEVIQENYKVIDLFIKRNNFEIKDPYYGINSRNEFKITFTNKGLASIYKPRFVITSDNIPFLKGVSHVLTRNEDDREVTIDISPDQDVNFNGLSFEVDKINRLDEFTLSLRVNDPSLLKSVLNMTVEVVMAEGSSIGRFDVSFDNDKFGGVITMTLLAMIALFLLMLIVLGLRIMRKSDMKHRRENMVDKPVIEANATIGADL